MKILFLWNESKYAELLANVYLSGSVVVSPAELLNEKEKLNQYEAAVALCELKWNLGSADLKMQSMQGIELVKELRRKHDLKIPVLFVSFQSLANIIKETSGNNTGVINPEREILTTIGHSFYQLPILPQDFKTFITKEFGENGPTKKLSVMELNDIKSFYCSKEGILQHELHALNSYLNYNITEDNEKTVSEHLQNSIRKIHDLFLVDSFDAVLSFTMKFKNLRKENINDAVEHINDAGNELLKTYSEKTNSIPSDEKVKEKFKWKVLLLDDEINKQHDLVQLMLQNKINVICVDNAPAAIQELTKDWKTENSIMVVIADYRLYEVRDGIKYHQKMQGYQFLKEIANSDHLVRLVAFSGLPRNFLMNSFEYYHIRTVVKSKKYYLSTKESLQFFCDEIIELAKDNLAAIEAMPSNSKAFKRTLESAYRMFRMDPGYNKMESNVSLNAKEYVWEIQQQIENGEEIKIKAISNITSPLKKQGKDLEAYFGLFQNYLVARRIAMWLFKYSKKEGREINNNIIAKILVDKKDYKPTDCRAVVNTNMGLNLIDFPKNITIEERRWLQYEMQINIFRDIQFVDVVLLKIASLFQSFLSEENELKQNITYDKLTIITEFKKNEAKKASQERYEIHFDKKLLPRLNTPTDVRMLFQYILANSTKKNSSEINDKKILPLASKLRMTLFEISINLPYQKNLFAYFNNEYRKLNKEKTIIGNAGSKVVDKSALENKGASTITQILERVWEIIASNINPIATDKADVFTVWNIAMDLIDRKGKTILNEKVTFFKALIKAINDENKSLDDNGGNDDDFTDNPDDEDLD